MANPTSSVATSVNTSGAKVVTTTTFTYPTQVVAKTAAYQVLAADDGKTFTNRGASGSVTFTLPPVQTDLAFKFTCVAAQNLLITGATSTIKGSAGAAATGETPAAFSGTTITVAGGTAANLFTTVSLYCDGTNWIISNIQGQASVA